MKDLVDWHFGKKDLPRNPLLLSFDDGYKNSYTVAYPLLKAVGIPAIVYLPTEMIGKKSVAWYDVIPYCIALTNKAFIQIGKKQFHTRTIKEKNSAIFKLREIINSIIDEHQRKRFFDEIAQETGVSTKIVVDENVCFVNWDECREMQKSGVEFGAHTLHHPILTNISEEILERELEEGKNMIRRYLGGCKHFSYPFGLYNLNVVRYVSKHYETAVTTKHGFNTKMTDLCVLRRIPVMNTHTNWMFALYLFWNVPLIHHLSVLFARRKIQMVGCFFVGMTRNMPIQISLHRKD